jgi:hypothetical protein
VEDLGAVQIWDAMEKMHAERRAGILALFAESMAYK